ncbi:MAG: ORF6N domain-containing protein [Ignavibacteria bacterium]|jgi:hypothetical protein|nr:ORF6N domain-containing protein [Ignavibacteria bacterium]
MEEGMIRGSYESLIFEFRGYKVMVDTDLASLYETETKVLKQQVKRNISRFPADFMFELTKEETIRLVTNCDRLSSLKHSNVNPLVFTEQGVAMLSSVLRSNKAIEMNIEIMRAFARYRAYLIDNKDITKRLGELDDKINRVFKYLLDKIQGFDSIKLSDARNKIGYKK